MDFKEYQKKSRETAIYPNKGENYIYPTLGLVGEAGEVAEKIKKVIRDNDYKITDKERETLKKEIGDVMQVYGPALYRVRFVLGGSSGVKYREASIPKRKKHASRQW